MMNATKASGEMKSCPAPAGDEQVPASIDCGAVKKTQGTTLRRAPLFGRSLHGCYSSRQ